MYQENIIFNRYAIIKQLHQGGFGITYLAKDTHMPNEFFCVLKKLDPQNRSPELLEIAKQKFKQEAEILHKLGYHDQIPRLYDYFTDKDDIYLVQELIEGQDLNQELNQKWDKFKIIFLLQSILPVLGFVHQHNCIHRDIKPANLMRRNKDSKICLIDFGTVKEFISEYTNAIGTPGYIPREQLEGTPHFNSDIYALGITCIQLMSNLKAQEIQSQLKINKEINQRIDFLQNHLEQVSPQFLEILDKMTRYDYGDRYQNVEEVLNDLSNLIASRLPSEANTILAQPENYITTNEILKPKLTKTNWFVVFLFFLLSISGISLVILQYFKWISFTPLCPPVFNTRVSWGNKYLVHSTETIDDSIKEATEKLNQACQTFGRSPTKIEKSIKSLELAVKSLKEARELDPENGQIIVYLQNSELLLKYAINAQENPNNYHIQPKIIGIAIPINVKNQNQDKKELQGIGNSQLIGASIYQKESNKILIVIDDQNDSSNDDSNVMKNIVKELKEKIPNILGVIGHSLSSVTQATIPFYETNEILLVSATSTADTEDIGSNNSRYFRRIVISNSEIAREMVEYIEDNIEAKIINKITIIYHDDTYGEDLSQNIKTLLENSNIEISREKRDVDPDINQSYIKDADVVILIPNANTRKEFVNLVKMAQEEDALIMAPDSMLNQFTLRKDNTNLCKSEGLLVFSPSYNSYFSGQVKKVIPPKSNLQSNIDLVDWRYAYSYDAAKAISQLSKSNPTNYSAIVGQTGLIMFDDENGNRAVDLEQNVTDIFEVTSECKFHKQD